MRTPREILTDESGATLLAMIILSMIMLLMTLSVFQFAAQDASLADVRVDRSKALYVAEAGLQRAHSWLEAQDDPPTGVADIEPFGAAPETLDCGTYDVTITPSLSNPGSARKVYTIRSQGVVDGEVRTVERDVMTQSYAQFIYFTEVERPPSSSQPVWFCSADYLDGALHTNGQIHIFGDPVFGGHVTSAHGGPDDPDPNHNPAFMYYNGSYYGHIESPLPSNAPYDEPTFNDGYELGAAEIELPLYVDDLIDLSQNGGVHLTGDYEVELARDDGGGPMYGYVSYRPAGGGSWTDVEISSFNGVMYVDGGTSVQGVLDGSLTIACGDDMYISDDVVYLDSDANGPTQGCTDMLGLVSESNVVVEDNSANQNDCNIHAHIMALNTSFEVENYRYGSPRGTLNIHGGIIQRYRGCVGTGYLNGDEIVLYSGYAKNYNFDERFEDLQPPGYLMTGEYYKLTWQEVTSA